MTTLRTLLTILILAGLAGCSPEVTYKTTGFPHGYELSPGTMIIVNSEKIRDMDFIPNQTAEVEFDIIHMDGLSPTTEGLKLVAEVTLDNSLSRATISSQSIIDINDNAFPVKAIALNAKRKPGFVVDCDKGKCSKFSINPRAERLSFIATEKAPVTGLTGHIPQIK